MTWKEAPLEQDLGQNKALCSQLGTGGEKHSSTFLK